MGKAEVLSNSTGEKADKSGNELQGKRYNGDFKSWNEQTGNISNTCRAEGDAITPWSWKLVAQYSTCHFGLIQVTNTQLAVRLFSSHSIKEWVNCNLATGKGHNLT